MCCKQPIPILNGSNTKQPQRGLVSQNCNQGLDMGPQSSTSSWIKQGADEMLVQFWFRVQYGRDAQSLETKEQTKLLECDPFQNKRGKFTKHFWQRLLSNMTSIYIWFFGWLQLFQVTSLEIFNPAICCPKVSEKLESDRWWQWQWLGMERWRHCSTSKTSWWVFQSAQT